MLRFDDVVKCSDIAELNLFIRRFFEERGIVVPSEDASRIYWALLYRWKESLGLG